MTTDPTMETKLRSKVYNMRYWIERNWHKPWNSDDLWTRIKRNWPTLNDEEAEHIFQRCWPSK